ncbi:MAG: DUF3467 domain-containing protein [Tidjanibacter sp.]|nr:DUF3467 domain-containing protein [Tidjanibacter sp.]
MTNEQKTQQKIEFELSPEVAQGQYANLAIIAHSSSEFILDFATMLPGMQKAKVKSRLVITPEHAKRLLQTLQENVARYERNFGQINPNNNVPHLSGNGFA